MAADSPDARLATFGRHLEAAPGFAFLREIVAAFPDAGVYAVGGIVRDVQIGREAKDYDFVVRGVPADALQSFLASRGSVGLVGRTFGVLKFVPEGWPEGDEQIDIALPRREHAEGTGGYRDFDVQTDPALPIEEDLSRRDFTVNAMAWDVRAGALVDPFDGRGDLGRKIIRAVGDAGERFTEDRSRMLRALRFSAQLDFDIDPETMAAIQALMPHINEERAPREYVTPREVVARELIKSFAADPVASLDRWDDAGAIRELIPELLAMKGCAQPDIYHSEGDVWTHTRLALSVLGSEAYRREFGDEPPSGIVTLGVLLHDIGKPPTQKTPERDGTDRIRFDGHDKVGGDMVRRIAERLTLAAPFPKGHPLHVDPEDLGLVVDHHLLLLQDPRDMRNATIEKYFFNPGKPGEALQRVSFCDGSAAIPAGGGSPDLAHFRALRERIEKMHELIAERNRLPKPVIDGNQIMARFGITPGPKVGEFITALREEQLTRLQRGEAMTEEEAYAFLEPIARKE